MSIDFKQGKKMKKRRQLDALVDTCKLPKIKSRNNSASTKELLDNDSDSSNVEEFNVSPSSTFLRKKCCTCQSIGARIGLFLVILALFMMCIGLIWVQWHMKHQLDSLEQQISKVRKDSNTAMPLLTLQTRLQEMNKTVTDIRTGTYGINALSTEVNHIKTEVDKLSKSVSKLEKAIPDKTDILNLPKKFETLTNTVTGMGADIKEIQKQSEQIQDLQSRLSTLETPKATDQTPTAETLPVADTGLQQVLSIINSTLAAKQSSLAMTQEKDEGRISILEDFINKNAQTIFNEIWIQHLISQNVEEMLLKNNDTSTEATQSSQFNKTAFNTLEQELITLKEETLVNFMHLNASILNINDYLKVLSEQVNILSDSALNRSTTASPGPAVVSHPQTINTTDNGPTSTEQVEKKNVIHIEGINSKEDFEKAFSSWPQSQTGLVSIEQLNKGPLKSTPLDVDTLNTYDLNGDGLFSLDELAKALGFSPMAPR